MDRKQIIYLRRAVKKAYQDLTVGITLIILALCSIYYAAKFGFEEVDPIENKVYIITMAFCIFLVSCNMLSVFLEAKHWKKLIINKGKL